MIEHVAPRGPYPAVTCSCCGETQVACYIPEKRDRMMERALCFECLFWSDVAEEVAAGHTLIAKGCGYSPAPDAPKGYEGFVGFGGAAFTFRRADGSTFTSRNVWFRGEVPAHWRERLPDNATIVQPGATP